MSVTKETNPPDDAPYLWDRPLRRDVTCQGCHKRAEPYRADCCWLCVTTGRAAKIKELNRAIPTVRR